MSTFVIENQDGTLSHPVARINVLRRFPHVSFPKVMTGYVNSEMGIYPLVQTEPPESQYSHVNVQVDPVKQGDHYVQQWGVAVPRPQDEIDAYYDKKIGMVKSYAGELILARYTDWKQRNMLMRVATLQNISPLTEDEQAELASISVAWDWIDAVRTASDTLEQDLLQMGIAAAMEYDVSSYPNWPA